MGGCNTPYHANHSEGGLPLITYAFLHAICTPSPLFGCNTQWKCIGGLTPPPLGAYVINGRPQCESDMNSFLFIYRVCSVTNFSEGN